jgi:PAS domain S-box-containing protein
MSTRSSFPASSILVPLIAALAIATICLSLYQREADQIKKGVLDRETNRTKIFARFYDQDIRSVLKDLQQMVDGDGLQSYLQTGKKEDLSRALHRAWFFSHQNPDYDQVRYIDEKGMEILRVNWDGEVVPFDQLQSDANRTYFQKANALSPGQYYVSAVDLNVENGAVEQPFKPIVCVAAPVFDPSGKRRGIYIINYLVANSIARLQKFTPQYQQRLRILNPEGYWIKAAQSKDEWGSMLSERKNATLAATDPTLWSKISNQPEGQTSYGDGYFTWARVTPSSIVTSPTDSITADDKFLVIASEISPNEWNAYFVGLRQTFSLVAIVLLLLMIASWRFFRARQEMQGELDRFFVLTSDMVCIAGFDGHFKRINPAWEKTLGYSREELISRPFLEFVHPDDQKKTIAETVKLTRGGETIAFENRYRCKDGSYRWLSWSARPSTEAQMIFASARDLTERKQIEETLRQSEERSRSIIASAYDGFISIDAEGKITDWNLQAETIFGWTRAEVLGRPLHETIIPPQYRNGHVQGMRHLKATGEGPVLNKRIELSALHKTGREFPVELAIWPLQMGRESTFHAFIRDITGRKEAEARIQKLNDETKTRSAQLEAANKELEAFSYSVSHDLRAPLRHIHGFVELLQSSPTIQADESSLRHMGVITRAAKQMGLLIDDLLAFSRTGRVEMHPTKVDMRSLIDQSIHEIEPEIQKRKIFWNIKPLPMVAGDPGLLHLVWMNLISNAVKYTRPREEARIEIGQAEVDPKTSKPDEVVFYIRDNGVGFDMAYASKLFGVFQRLHRVEDFEGTGIGLANVQRIIHRHGGRVWAQSQINQGTTFYFSLPTHPTLTPTAAEKS